MNSYYVYILASWSRAIYTGITNNLQRRIWEHKHKVIPGFTSNYNVNRLVYFEETCDVNSAIRREKEIKGWVGAKKIKLIESVNPMWKDLSDDWFGD